ncbi:MAG: M20/M25/M40 family metallo-hydrolase, partial [Planctomycetota bacterium]
MTAAVATSDNVVGVISGRGDLADETIVIGAHYDHVGMGGEGSLAPGTVAVHNGADDNASGTATMLAVASRMNRSLIDVRSHRRVVFIAFTGEERGLLGSKHYVDQPRFPISETVAMINMDMVGRLRDRELTVYGTGSATMFDDLLDETLAELSSDSNLPPLQLFRVASGYGPSDHASFYAAGVPVLFFFTGLHTDYHRPSDDFEKLNLDGMIRITDMVCQVSMSLATMKSRPVYAVTSDKITIRRQITVFLGVSLNQQPNGVLISNVVPNSPADTAGWLVGDQLITLDGRPIQRVKDVFDLLREKSPEQTLPATVRRAGQDVRVVAKLAKRES